MSYACTSILVGVVPPVSEIWLPLKNGQISLSGHYSPLSSKNLIDPELAQKIHASRGRCVMHVYQFWWV